MKRAVKNTIAKSSKPKGHWKRKAARTATKSDLKRIEALEKLRSKVMF